jgi:hypothetical protein
MLQLILIAFGGFGRSYIQDFTPEVSVQNAKGESRRAVEIWVICDFR